MQPSTLDQTLIWASIRENDEQALYQLYHFLYDRLFRHGIRICPDTELVKDSINLLFTEIWEKRISLPELENVSGYVFIWYKRKLYKQLKENKARQFIDEATILSMELEEKSYEETLISIENNEQLKEKIRKALDSLTDRQRELIQLRFFEDMGFEEMATKTNTSIRTIYNTIHAAINRLKIELGDSSISVLLPLVAIYTKYNFIIGSR